LTTNDEDVDPDKENKDLWERRLYDSFRDWKFNFWNRLRYLRKSFWNYKYSSCCCRFKYSTHEERLLEYLHETIVEIIYDRLKSKLYQHAKTEIHRRKRKCTPNGNDEWISSGILESENFRNEIRKCIVNEIYKLTPEVENMRKSSVEKIREHGGALESWSTIASYSDFLDLSDSDTLSYENMQEIPLSYEVVLDKLRQCSPIKVEELRQCAVKRLYGIALKQGIQWEGTEEEIIELRQILSRWWSPEHAFNSILPQIHKKYRISQKRSLPKIQPKHSMRRSFY
jgi:hypothetical protein